MTTWTAERDRQILLLLVDQYRPDFKKLAVEWKKEYVENGIDEYQPSPVALSKHFAALRSREKKRNAHQGLPKTPKSSLKMTSFNAISKGIGKAPMTPISIRKRKRASKLSDDSEVSNAIMSEEEVMKDEDTTDEEAVLNTPVPDRRRTSNRVLRTPAIKRGAAAVEDTAQEESSLESEASNFSDADAE